MARKAFVAGATKRISHPDDKDNPTIYIIQALPYRVTNWIRDNAFTTLPGIGSHFHAGRTAQMNLQAGLLGIENLLGPDGKAVEIKTTTIDLAGGGKHTCVDPTALDLLTMEDAAWLSDQIIHFSTATEEEVKKSDAPS
jgi:hypothetical protein